LDALYLDNHLLVAVKPAGMLSQADKTGDPDMLSLGKAYLKERFEKPGAVFLGLVHRLDRPASGVMVFARTSKAAARLSEQFRRHTPVKRYLAIVEGRLEGEDRWVDQMLKDEHGPRIVSAGHPKAKRATLSWRALGVQNGCTLVEVGLETGRAHQIRLQFARRGRPLLGDLRHGATRPFDGRNLALHSYSLEIEHPTQKRAMRWRAPPPASWAGWFEQAIATLFK